MVRPMVHSTKHYVQQSIGTVVVGTNANTTLVTGVAVAAKDAVSEVEEGSTVKAIYLELWIRSAAVAAASFTFAFFKLPSGAGFPSETELAALGNWDNKKNILYTSQGLINDVDSSALNLFKGWIKIPKGKQRIGLGDNIGWSLRTVGQSLNFCGFSLYKEYS